MYGFSKSSSWDWKKIFRFGFGVLRRRTSQVGLSFSFFWPTLRGPGRQSNEQLFSLKFLFETRLSSESLKLLIWFLTYLDPKLCHKNQKVVKISTPTKGNLGWITPSLDMAINLRQNRLESFSSPLKTREDL